MAGKVNLNTASKQELEHVKSIGPERADRVIEYRESHGGFKSVDELKNVKGFEEQRLHEVERDATV